MIASELNAILSIAGTIKGFPPKSFTSFTMAAIISAICEIPL